MLLILDQDLLGCVVLACTRRARAALRCVSHETSTALTPGFQRADKHTRGELLSAVSAHVLTIMPRLYTERDAQFELFGSGLRRNEPFGALQVFDELMTPHFKFENVIQQYVTAVPVTMIKRRHLHELQRMKVKAVFNRETLDRDCERFVDVWSDLVFAFVGEYVTDRCQSAFEWIKRTPLLRHPPWTFDALRRCVRFRLKKGPRRDRFRVEERSLPARESKYDLFFQTLLHLVESLDGRCETGDCRPFAHNLELV